MCGGDAKKDTSGKRGSRLGLFKMLDARIVAIRESYPDLMIYKHCFLKLHQNGILLKTKLFLLKKLFLEVTKKFGGYVENANIRGVPQYETELKATDVLCVPRQNAKSKNNFTSGRFWRHVDHLSANRTGEHPF